MKVKFYTSFSKKFNSTKTPLGSTPYIEIEGEIKGNFSPLAPVIRFQGSTYFPATAVPSYRYAYIASFSRYYFVSWAFIDGAWEGSFKCDVLGSFASDIKSSAQYVARSASVKNGFLMDASYASTTGIGRDLQSVSQSSIFGVGYESGTFIVGVVGAAATAGEPRNIGSTVYYAMGAYAFTALMSSLLSSTNWLNIDPGEISVGLQKALINPAQYIVSCVWLPISASEFVDGTGQGWTSDIIADISQTIIFGWWTFNLGYNTRKLGKPLAESASWHKSFSFNLVNHPQISTFGDWVNLSPHTRRTLSIPFFGTVELDTTKIPANLSTDNLITVDYYIHSYNGDSSCYVWNGGTVNPRVMLLADLRGNVGVQIPTGQVRMDLGNFKNSLIGGAVVAGADELASIMSGGD